MLHVTGHIKYRDTGTVSDFFADKLYVKNTAVVIAQGYTLHKDRRGVGPASHLRSLPGIQQQYRLASHLEPIHEYNKYI